MTSNVTKIVQKDLKAVLSNEKSKPKKFEKNKIIFVPNENENPFKNAEIENRKIELKLENEKQKLINFNKKVKERIKAYKNAEQKLEEDSQLIINKKNRLKNFKKIYEEKLTNLNKFKSKSAIDLTDHKPIKKIEQDDQTSFKPSSSASCLSDDLPDFVLRSILDPNEIAKINKEEYKKRITSVRKIYSNMERDKIKQESITKILKNKSLTNLNKQENKLETTRVVIEKKAKEKERVRIERNLNCLKNDNNYPVLHSAGKNGMFELKQFVNIENENEKNLTELKPITKFTLKSNKEKNDPCDVTAKSESKIKSKPTNISSNSNRNINKYIKYLKQLLKEKSAQYKFEIPPLCQCNIPNDTKLTVSMLWENDWNKCANNCLFYNNPREYAKVLLYLLDKSVLEKDRLERHDTLVPC